MTEARQNRFLQYQTQWQCEVCRTRYDGWDPGEFVAPGEDCPACGGQLTERDLQFPSIGSTAYECEHCGGVAFDTPSVPEDELCPDRRRSDAVGPDFGIPGEDGEG